MLSCSVGNSKSQLYKAKLRFRELLTPSPEAPVATRSRQQWVTDSAKAKPENWDLPINLDVVTPLALVATQS